MTKQSKRIKEILEYIKSDLDEVLCHGEIILDNEIPDDEFMPDDESINFDNVKNAILIKKKIERVNELISMIELNHLD